MPLPPSCLDGGQVSGAAPRPLLLRGPQAPQGAAGARYTGLHQTRAGGGNILHYTTLHYTRLHYTTLHYTTPRRTTPWAYHTPGPHPTAPLWYYTLTI